MKTLKIGSFVKSTMGRDKDNIYIVFEIFEKSVALVDGNGKTLDKPKIKNTKHIEVLEGSADKIAEKFINHTKVFDAEVYSAIKKFKEN